MVQSVWLPAPSRSPSPKAAVCIVPPESSSPSQCSLWLQARLSCDPHIPSRQHHIVSSIITFYMISTAALAGRCTSMGPLEWGALLVGIGGVAAVPTLAAAVLTVAIHSVRNPATADSNASHQHRLLYGSRPPARRSGDIRVLARGHSSGRQPITRHLWRMCFGLFIAQALSFSASSRSFPLSCAARSSTLFSP